MSITSDALEGRVLPSAHPVGPEFRVSPQTTGTQSLQAMVGDSGGNFVVIWSSPDLDGSGSGLFGQRYDSQGDPIEDNFQVNIWTTGDQNSASAAMNAAGEFVVTWNHRDSTHGFSQGIYARRFDRNGVPVTDEILVDIPEVPFNSSLSVAIDNDGSFVIAWESPEPSSTQTVVMARLFDTTGNALGGEFRVNEILENEDAIVPEVGTNASGHYVFTWTMDEPDDNDPFAAKDIYARQYDRSNNTFGQQLRVNSTSIVSMIGSHVSVDPDGDFVVSWSSYAEDISSSDAESEVYFQRFSSDGTPLGIQTQVNAVTDEIQEISDIAMGQDGDFVITWQSWGEDGNRFGVFAREFNSEGTPRGESFQVNTFTSHHQIFPSVAMDLSGNYVIAWSSRGQESSETGIYAQRYRASQTDGIGTWRNGAFYLDSDQSETWSNSPEDTLFTFGNPTDKPLVGDWNGDGYSEIGVARNAMYYLDLNGNGLWDGPTIDAQFQFGNPTDRPIVGDWNRDGRDDIGVWRDGKFYFDANGNRTWDGPGIDATFTFGNTTDTPIAGDWNGDGFDDIGVVRNGRWYLDLNGNRAWDGPSGDETFVFGNPSDLPLTGDWNGDGKDDIGIWRSGSFYLDSNSNRLWEGMAIDTLISYGGLTDSPLIGSWKPKSAAGPLPIAPLHAGVNVFATPVSSAASHSSALASLISSTKKSDLFLDA